MKSYKFRFSKLVLVLIGLAIAAALAAVAYTVYRIYLYGFSSPLLVIQHVAVLIVAALAIVIFVSLLIRSVYKITDTQIILWFGIVKQTFKIANIESVHLFTKTNKLVIYFKDDKYTVIVVKPEWYNEFTKEILARNDKIRYDVSTTDKDETE